MTRLGLTMSSTPKKGEPTAHPFKKLFDASENVSMSQIHSGNWNRLLAVVIGGLLILRVIQVPIESADKDDVADPALQAWLKPQEWRRDSETPALELGEEWTLRRSAYFCSARHPTGRGVLDSPAADSGSQRCVEAGRYKGWNMTTSEMPNEENLCRILDV